MKIVYDAKRKIASYSKQGHVFLADKGSYAMLGVPCNTTIYNGVFFFDEKSLSMKKLLHDIRPKNSIKTIINKPEEKIILTQSISQRMMWKDNVFCISITGNGKIIISLDARESYDLRDDDRKHDVMIKKDGDNNIITISSKAGDFFIVTNGKVSYKPEWNKKEMPYDASRGQSKYWWVLDGLEIIVDKKASIVVSDDINKALSAIGTYKTNNIIYEDVIRENLKEGLFELTIKDSIIAGLPWFFQVWSRDEAISTIGHIVNKEYLVAANILLKEVDRLTDGRLPNRFPESNIGSADATLWLWSRLSDLLNKKPDAIQRKSWRLVLNRCAQSIRKILPDEGFVYSAPQETWMDTTGGTGDTREGYCIEIQSLMMRALSFHNSLSDYLGEKKIFSDRLARLKKDVIKEFYDPKRQIIADRINDWTIRVNVIIAAYVYWELLKEDEWVDVIKNTLKALRLSWGGLSSIDKNNHLFTPKHTGVSDRSYHRGDSWYFTNNMAGVVLLRLKEHFTDEINHLLRASVNDLLWQGCYGRSSEISSAKIQEPFGCFSQAWSCATLIEFYELFCSEGFSFL